MKSRLGQKLGAVVLVCTAGISVAQAQTAPNEKPAGPPVASAQTPSAAAGQPAAPPDYVLGPDDVVGVVFWRDQAMTTDVTVRPDGKISLPLLHDVPAAGMTPEALRQRITELAKQYIEEPNVSVIVRQMNSRKVFITGQVTRPGSYAVSTPTTVLQLIALAGGLSEFAGREEIAIIRPGEARPLRFNYDEVLRGKKMDQNIFLKVGDTVVVP